MELIPAIDLKGGHCVRLRRGKMDDSTVYSADPLAQARRWGEAGCRRLHVVDLDGAVTGEPYHAGQIRAIAAALPQLALQVGGGVRDAELLADYLAAGIDRVVIGTLAQREPDLVADWCRRFPARVAIGLDARDGQLAVAGWVEQSDSDVIGLACHFAAAGVAALIHTDIDRDGMRSGVNLAATLDLVRKLRERGFDTPVIASGGLRDLAELRVILAADQALAEELRTAAFGGSAPGALAGVIAGRSLYEGTLDLRAGLALCRESG